MVKTWRAAVCGGLLLAGPAGAAESWVGVKSPSFTVVSNAGEGTARQTAWEFEQVRAAYARLWPWARLAEGRATVVVALKDEKSLSQWAPEYFEAKGGIRIASVSSHGADADYLLLRPGLRPGSRAVDPNYNLYRAYLHSLLSASLDRRLPLWLSNGLAAVFGNTSVRDKEVHVGQPVPWHLQRFSDGPRLPLRTVLEAQPGSDLALKDGQREVFDAACWVLVHYLTFADNGAHTAQLDRFIRLWLAGQPQERALAEALGDLAALEKQLPTYATRSILPFGRLQADVNIELARPPVRLLAAAEVASLQAAVHVAMDRPDDAEAAVQRARSADPGAPGSYDAEGLLADRQKQRERAVQAFEQATQRGSTRAHSWYRAAQLAWTPSADAAVLATLRQRLERAVELNPSYADARSFLAEVLVQQGQAAAALPQAERAVALEPGESYHQLALARTLQKLGRAGDARAAAQRGLQLADTPSERDQAQRLLTFLVQDNAFQQRRAAQQARQEKLQACSGGDAAACADALPELESSCEEGSAADACTFAAWLHREGRGVPKDAARSAALLDRACRLDDKRSCVEFAWAQAHGDGLPKAEPAARALLEALCGDEVFLACTRLALLHAAVPKVGEQARAKELLARACAGGESDACRMVQGMK